MRASHPPVYYLILKGYSMPGFLEVYGYYDPELKGRNIDVRFVRRSGQMRADSIGSQRCSSSYRQ